MRVLLIAGAIALVGCSSNPQVTNAPQQGQYCYTDQTIVNKNNSSSSETIVSCSDKPKVNHVTRSAGVAQQCSSYQHRVVINGVPKYVKGFLCKFPNGRWEPVNDVFAY